MIAARRLTTDSAVPRTQGASRGRAVALCLAFASLCASGASAQRAGLSSPGNTGEAGLGQSTRYDNEFNPAISLALDLLYDWKEIEGSDQDGLKLDLRRVDLLLADWIDPNALAWVTIAYEEDELGLDEAAIEYVGLPGNHTLRGGRFFVDFGKQMQSHVESLRTIDRPLVLREFLGEELAGDGLQWDNWFAVGEATMVRYSLGAFADLSGGHHVHGAAGTDEPELHVDDRKRADELGFTGRLSALTEVGANGTLQLGASGRFLGDFAFEHEGSELEQSGQSNAVYGLDLTYAWVDDTGLKSWTGGGEFLLFDGDLGAELDDGGTPANAADDALDITRGSVSGAYIFADRAWNANESAGIQYSTIEEPRAGEPRAQEYDLYYTRQLSEYLRLRIGVGYTDREAGLDSTRVGIQLTGFIGPHGHGLNW